MRRRNVSGGCGDGVAAPRNLIYLALAIGRRAARLHGPESMPISLSAPMGEPRPNSAAALRQADQGSRERGGDEVGEPVDQARFEGPSVLADVEPVPALQLERASDHLE